MVVDAVILPSLALASTTRPLLLGTEPGALLAGIVIAVALAERGVVARLATNIHDPLSAALSRTLAARSMPADIERVELPSIASSEEDGVIALGSGAMLEDAALVSALAARETSLLALLGLGSEPCAGHDPDRSARRVMACLADGSLLDRTLLHPFDPAVRTWLEIVEDVHHAVGPGEQQPIVDVIRAALFGRHGPIAVDLAARERKALVTMESASIVWLRPARM